MLIVEEVAGAAADFDARLRRCVDCPAYFRNMLYGAQVVNRRARHHGGRVAFAEDLPLGRGADAAVKGFEALGHGEEQPHVANLAQWEVLLKMADLC